MDRDQVKDLLDVIKANAKIPKALCKIIFRSSRVAVSRST
jgi:hypothetical protein